MSLLFTQAFISSALIKHEMLLTTSTAVDMSQYTKIPTFGTVELAVFGSKKF